MAMDKQAARRMLEQFFDKLIGEYKIQERDFTHAVLGDLFYEAAWDNGFEAYRDRVMKDLPEFLYLTFIKFSRDIGKDAQDRYTTFTVGMNDQDLANMSETEAYGLIYERTLKSTFATFQENTIRIGAFLLGDTLEKLGFKYNADYKDLANHVAAHLEKTARHIDFEDIAMEMRPGDLSMSIEGSVMGLLDIKSMNFQSLKSLEDIYRNLLKKVPVNDAHATYKEYQQALANSFKFDTSLPRTLGSNNVLIFLFRDEAIWVSELLTRVKDLVVTDWLDRIEKGTMTGGK